jgi:hypothetical protein
MTFMRLIIRNYSQHRRLSLEPGGMSRSTMRAGRSVNAMREVRQEMSGKKVVTGKGKGMSCVVLYIALSHRHLV